MLPPFPHPDHIWNLGVPESQQLVLGKTGDGWHSDPASEKRPSSAGDGTGVEELWKLQVLTKLVSSDKGLTRLEQLQSTEENGDYLHSTLAPELLEAKAVGRQEHAHPYFCLRRLGGI